MLVSLPLRIASLALGLMDVCLAMLAYRRQEASDNLSVQYAIRQRTAEPGPNGQPGSKGSAYLHRRSSMASWSSCEVLGLSIGSAGPVD